MSVFNFSTSAEKARRRLGGSRRRSLRRPRSDRGRSRLPSPVLEVLREMLLGQERPRMRELLADLHKHCRERALAPPSRATVYKLMGELPCPKLRVGDLPAPVQHALYNFEPESEVPAHQVAFHCFNHGSLPAISFAASLPWLAIYQALRMHGYRARSRGLVLAVARVRGI